MGNKEIVTNVKEILESISKSKFAYDESMKTINFDLAITALSLEDKRRLSETLESFSKSSDQRLSETIFDNLALYLDVYYRIILDLKKVAKHGNVYYNIIMRYYIDKEFDNIDEAVEAIDGIGSRGTFFRRANDACNQLYIIWSCTGPRYISSVLNEFISL